MNRYLFFDTETSGLPKDYKAHPSNIDNWPRIVQFIWSIYEIKNGEPFMMAEDNYIIKPEGFEIPKAASDIHGITQERALKDGEQLSDILTIFRDVLFDYDSPITHLIAHNFNYDSPIIQAEYYRHYGDAGHNFSIAWNNIKQTCTMLSSTDYCRIPGKYGFKWPKLSELHWHLFHSEFEGVHDALFDVRATVKCFFELVKRGVIKV